MANDDNPTMVGALNQIAKSIGDLTNGNVQKQPTVVEALQEINTQIENIPPAKQPVVVGLPEEPEAEPAAPPVTPQPVPPAVTAAQTKPPKLPTKSPRKGAPPRKPAGKP
jgi:hypothetical protein